MSIWKLVRLKFGRNVAHFGELGIGIEETSERVRSDTLFSAWISAYARLGENVEELLEKFTSQAEPPFRLSSTFIYQQVEGELVYYLPRPRKVPPKYPINEDLSFAKDYKELEYLPLDVWHCWYQSDVEVSIEADVKALTDPGAKRNYKNAFKDNKIPKIAVDRITRATNLYHTGLVQYRWQPNQNELDGIESLSGLYFLVKFSNLEWVEPFFATLDFLGGEGIGGERSSGAGQFRVDRSPKESINTDPALQLTPLWKQAIAASNANAHMLMSLFWTDDRFELNTLLENENLRASYELQERGGWITSSASNGRQLRRKTVQMFAEGSVFLKTPIGKLADVTPKRFTNNHLVYRSGISLSLPINIHKES